MEDKGPLTVALVSLGCPKNLVDSEAMLARLAEAGCFVGAPMDDADVIVVNTCGFLSAATDESLGVINEAIAHKTRGRARRVVVAGCLCNRQGRRLFDIAPGIDAVVGVNDRDDIVRAVADDGRLVRLAPCAGRIHGDAGRFRLTPRHIAYLRIAEGCSQKCSFCTIPAIRGPFRSKAPEEVIAEAEELVADGAVELNIIAQETTSYGSDIDGADLCRLLRRLDALQGLRWVRLLYTYPRRFTDELIDTVAALPRVVPYVDLPLQHVSDDILRRMGRGVTRGSIETLLEKLRRRIDGLVLRTTFIVGFPGETEAHFDELLEFVGAFRFEAAGVFEFSPEEGTLAADMPDQVDEHRKTERRERLMLAQQRVAFENNAHIVGKQVEVLADGRRAGRYYGQAPDIDSVCLLTRPVPAGEFAAGRIVDVDGYDLVVEPETGNLPVSRFRSASARKSKMNNRHSPLENPKSSP